MQKLVIVLLIHNGGMINYLTNNYKCLTSNKLFKGQADDIYSYKNVFIFI